MGFTEEHYKKIQNYCIENGINAFGVEFGEIKKQYDEIKKQYDEIKKQWYETRAYFDNTHDNMNNVWHFGRTSASERELTGGHNTGSLAIKSRKQSVLDAFGGRFNPYLNSSLWNLTPGIAMSYTDGKHSGER